MKLFPRLIPACLLLAVAISSFAQNSQPFSFAVKKVGAGRPMILLPGLYSSGEVWTETAAHLANRYECHLITLPGFAGQPAITGDSLLTTVVRQLAAYIRQNKLHKPILVGHSLGGWLALDFGVRYPELAGDIICVSSSPFLPALMMGSGATVDSTRRMALQIKQGMQSQTPAQVRQGQQQYLPTMIRDSARIAQVVDMAVQSDPATQGEVMYELFSNDLRPALGAIRSRILVAADWSAYKAYGATRESVYNNLKEQFAHAPQVSIVINDLSKHFIMFDEPAWLWSEMDAFLDAR